MSFIVKAPVLVLAWAFWAIIGLFIWTRVLVLNFVVFAMMIALAPFGRGPPDPGPAQRFDKALGLYGYGFGRIWRSVNGAAAAPDDIWEGDQRRGVWGTIGNFVWQSVATLAFWAPVVLVLHYGQILRFGFIARAENAFARSIGIDGGEPAAQSECRGATGIARLGQPQSFETTQDVNVRGGAGTEFPRIARLKRAQHVAVLGRTPSGQWSLVSVEGKELCFVASDYLRPKH